MGGPKREPATLVITAADGAAVTYRDIMRQFIDAEKGRAKAFFECNHAFLEGISWAKPGHYNCWFGS